jgi:hypothetical protein
MFDSSVIKRTGQWWKVLLALWGGLAFGAAAFVAARVIQPVGWSGPLTLSGSLAGVGCFAFLCWSIRCPRCGARWYWLSVSDSAAKGWDRHVLLRPTCPACGAEFR